MQAYTREKLLSHLQGLTELSNLYKERSVDYPIRVIQWMQDLEETLGKLRSPLSGFVAAERGKVIASVDGYCDPYIQPAGSGRSSRRNRQATAALGVANVQERLQQTIEHIDHRFEEVREKIAQLLAVVSAQSPIPMPQEGESRSGWHERVWQQLPTNGNTQGMVEYLRTSLKHSDLLYVLGETLDNLVENAGSPTNNG
ncbi:hypothetical protein P4C99_12290 [Pontiellaceae bacterium B1224]|nr:hypothetical protein [Pontiellaceae bacterium B1224]